MRILIIEDEKSSADRLCSMLTEMTEQKIEVCYIAQSNAQATQWLDNTNTLPDLILADIQLGDGLSFEAISTAPSSIPVVFTTAYDQYAIDAFNYNGIAYLLKPIDKEELHGVIRKIVARNTMDEKHNPCDTQNLQAILTALRDGGMRYRERFLISFRDEMKVVNASEVSHIGLVDGITTLYTHTGKQYIITQSLEELESQLNPASFMRVNRQYIVSINSVDSLVTYFLGKMKLKLKNYRETEIIISRAKVPQIKKWLDW